MSRHTLSRIDRVAQMSIQEEIIAKKKLELIEKQKTAELAKQVVAAQTGNSSKPKKEKPATLHKPNVLLEPASPKNNFNNDGSFFENFKKITDAAKKAQEDAMPPPIVVPEIVVEQTPEIENNDILLLDDPTLAINSDITEVFISNFQQNAAALCSAPPPPPPPPPSPPKPAPQSDQIHESDSSQNQNNTFMGGNNQSNDKFRNQNDYQPPFFDDCNDDEFHGNATSPSFSKPMHEQLQRPPPYQNINFQESHSQQNSRPMSNNNFPSNGARDFHNKFNKPNTNVPPPNFDNIKRFGDDQSFQKSGSQFEQSRFAQETAPKSFSPSFANDQSRTGGNQMYAGGNNSNNSNTSNNFISNTNNNPFPSNSNDYSDDDADDIPFNEPPPSNRFAPNQVQSTGQFPTPDQQSSNQQHNNPFGQAGNRFGQNQNRFNQFPQDRGANNGQPNRFTGNTRFVPDKPSPTVSPNPNYQNPFASNTNKPPPSVVPMLNTMPPFAQPPPITPNNSQQPQPSVVAFNSAPPNFLNRPPMAFTQPIVNTATAPPPITTTALPPPPIFSQFPPLHTIPPPKPMSLNKIPPPRELDLNAIPEPTFDLDAIKVPDHSISRDHEFIPTSVESLVDLVAENGDEYEDKLRLRKIDMHSSLWFLCEKGSLAYRNYRKKVMEVRYNTTGSNNSQDDCSDKYDPAEMYDDYKDDDEDDEDVPVENHPINSGGERYDDAKSKPSNDDDNDYDSDAEFQNQSNKRNFAQMKRNLDNSHNRDYYSSDSDDDGNNDNDNRVDPAPRAVDVDMRILPQMMKKQKRSRWGEKEPNAVRPPVPPQAQPQMLAMLPTTIKNNNPFGSPKVMLTGVTRSDPALLQYARANYGTVNLDEDEWRKCEDHYKVNLLYQDLLKKRNEIDRLASSGRFKYEYDSDEDVSGGTWEHKLRNAEMEATAVWSDALTKQAEGKHHIGDFLPPEELKKFMEKYESQQNNREPDISDYREYKLKEDNKGFQMLQKLGWKEGQGLGFGGSGIVDPVNKAHQRDSNQGLGATTSSGPDFGDNEYDAYRKRMMLAYRFRPNPLNNPRRAYY